MRHRVGTESARQPKGIDLATRTARRRGETEQSCRSKGCGQLEAAQRRRSASAMPVQEIKLKAASDAPSKSGLENVPPDQLERAMKAAMARSDGDSTSRRRSRTSSRRPSKTRIPEDDGE